MLLPLNQNRRHSTKPNLEQFLSFDGDQSQGACGCNDCAAADLMLSSTCTCMPLYRLPGMYHVAGYAFAWGNKNSCCKSLRQHS
jgi:hypothetical protein